MVACWLSLSSWIVLVEKDGRSAVQLGAEGRGTGFVLFLLVRPSWRPSEDSTTGLFCLRGLVPALVRSKEGAQAPWDVLGLKDPAVGTFLIFTEVGHEDPCFKGVWTEGTHQHKASPGRLGITNSTSEMWKNQTSPIIKANVSSADVLNARVLGHKCRTVLFHEHMVPSPAPLGSASVKFPSQGEVHSFSSAKCLFYMSWKDCRDHFGNKTDCFSKQKSLSSQSC